MASWSIDTDNTVVWGIIPKYRPSSFFKSGIVTINGVGNAMGVSINNENGYIYQTIGSTVSKNTIVTFYVEYYID